MRSKPSAFALRKEFDYERPRLKWEDSLAKVDEIIARVGKPWCPPAAKDQRPNRPGADLSFFREEIAHLLAEVLRVYLDELDDFVARNGADRPPRWSDEVTTPGAGQLVDDDLYELLAQDAGACIDGSWAKLWDDYYGRKRGNPGASRTGGPPLPPARAIYLMVRTWWRERHLSEFTPSFANGDEEANHNDASRFLLAVLQSVEPRYTVAHARGLYETDRKAKSRRAKKTE